VIAEHWVLSQERMLAISSDKGLMPSPKAYGFIILAVSKKTLRK
jgi:hypothetical protein